MRILIVNGFPKTTKGNEDFHKFQAIIQEVFRTQHDFVDTTFDFITRGRDDLDDFIYELDSPYLKSSSAQAFDYIDMVFVGGDCNLLPWFPEASKVLVLLRMCIRVKKPLFCSGFGMLAMVFLAATNIEKNIKVINGRGKARKLADITNFTQAKHEECYVDFATGDLYFFNSESGEWTPKMNAGLHCAHSALTDQTIGKYVINKGIYKAKTFDDNSLSFLSKPDEDFCYTKKIYLQHWAICELPTQFVIPAKNNWNIHKFNFVNDKKTFIVLAESRKCPQIIVFEPYCLGTLFNITKKYPLTVSILKNFIHTKLKEIKSMNKNEVIGIKRMSELLQSKATNAISHPQNYQSDKALDSARSHAGIKINEKDFLENNHPIRVRPQTAKLAHSGFALAHHEHANNLIVDNNTIRSTAPIKLDTSKRDQIMIRTIQSPVKPQMSPRSETNFESKFIASSPSNQFAKSGQDGKNLYFGQFKNETMSESPVFQQNGSQNSLLQTSTSFKKNRAEIARMLYPDLPRNALKEEEFWVPGELSKSRPQSAASKNKVQVKMEGSFSNRFYSSYNKFKFVNPDDARAKPSIRTSGEYITETEKKRLEERESSKKNLGPAYFVTTKKNSTPNLIPNYVTLTFSEPPANHKFRETQKNKWVAGPMKLC